MATSELRFAIKPSLTASELDDVDTLVREARWNQLAADWRIFTDLGRVYAAHTGADRIVATTATLPYGSRFAWISMVLVKSEFRRHGLATQLMRQAMDELAREGRIPILDATPDGRAVYRRLGFEDSWGFAAAASAASGTTRSGDLCRPGGGRRRTRASSIDDWPALCAYDAAAFGADRGAVLDRPARAPAGGRVRRRARRPHRRLRCSAATACWPAQLVSADCRRRRHRGRAARTRARCASTVRCSSTSPTQDSSCETSSTRAASTSVRPFTRMLYGSLDALRRPGADLRRGRPGVRLIGPQQCWRETATPIVRGKYRAALSRKVLGVVSPRDGS